MKSEVGSWKDERKSDLPERSFEFVRRIVVLCRALDEKPWGSYSGKSVVEIMTLFVQRIFMIQSAQVWGNSRLQAVQK